MFLFYYCFAHPQEHGDFESIMCHFNPRRRGYIILNNKQVEEESVESLK
jgi:hypothetical protein